MTLKLAETSAVKSRPSVPYGANLLTVQIRNWFGETIVGDVWCFH